MKGLVTATLLLASFVGASALPRTPRPVGIAGGRDAKPGEAPYQVSVQKKVDGGGQHFCGAVIYNEHYLISTAQCFDDGVAASDIRIVVGTVNLTAPSDYEQMSDISSIIPHENYDKETQENDIALLKLSATLNFTKYVAAAELPAQGQSSSGEGLISGFGAKEEGGDFSDVLQIASVPIINDTECRSYYGKKNIQDSMICGYKDGGGVDSCNGDIGGPMLCEDSKGGSYLCGVSAFGYGCARAGAPGVYTEISYFVDWITSNSK